MPIKNGSSFWTWIRRQDGSRIRVPLGTADKATAKRAEQVLAGLADKWQWELLEAVVARRLTVPELVAAKDAGAVELAAVRSRLTDPDLAEHVVAWKEWAGRSLTPKQVDRYARQLQALIPDWA